VKRDVVATGSDAATDADRRRKRRLGRHRIDTMSSRYPHRSCLAWNRFFA